MNYRSVDNLNADIRELAFNLPNDIDLIVGIPRSGMLAGNLLALHLNLPLTDVDGFCEERLLQSGRRHEKPDFSDIENVLIIDDSVCHGTQMEKTQSRIESKDLSYNIEYAAIYITPKGHQYVDHWAEVIDIPRYFEWNIMHHDKLSEICVDIDGVLCRDPESRENDDGENYLEFVSTVEPRVVPTKKIGWLVTSRLEKYREETEEWLDENGIEYGELIMMDHPDMMTRQMEGDHSDFKSQVYESVDAELFIESSPDQSIEIVQKTGKPVFCVKDNAMVYPDSLSASKRKFKSSFQKSEEYLSRFSRNPFGFLREAAKHVIGKISDLNHKKKLLLYRIKNYF